MNQEEKQWWEKNKSSKYFAGNKMISLYCCIQTILENRKLLEYEVDGKNINAVNIYFEHTDVEDMIKSGIELLNEICDDDKFDEEKIKNGRWKHLLGKNAKWRTYMGSIEYRLQLWENCDKIAKYSKKFDDAVQSLSP